MNGECIKTHQIATDPILTWTVEMIKKYETFLVRQYLVMETTFLFVISAKAVFTTQMFRCIPFERTQIM